ncbi:MAG: type II toxin-antitoxin system ParD family antitoxin [Gammaproteobacteria bacterium]|nr:type II toxin-antitoxin system ParD family antitoxin [Gammaproteobacteria bacterium]MCY4339099.1 type II toxin-antitoxin system ParD family antitoxin [Gammaproteobacteria bacterium]
MFSEPNHAWLQSKVDSREFRNHTEVVNDALRKARDMENGVEAIRRRLMMAENSGFTDMTMDEIWAEARRRDQVLSW